MQLQMNIHNVLRWGLFDKQNNLSDSVFRNRPLERSREAEKIQFFFKVQVIVLIIFVSLFIIYIVILL